MKSNVQEIDIGRMISSTVIATTIHTLIPLFCVFFAIYILPQFLLKFMEMNVPLPLPTRIAIKACSFFSHFWYLCLYLFSWILLVDGTVYYLLRRRSGKIYSFLYSVAVVLAEGVLAVLCIIVLCLPLMKIITRIE